jgi:hypothetical protein
MIERTSCRTACAVLVTAVMCQAGTGWAGVHTWDVNEVFSDASGQIQFVELKNPPANTNETGLNGQTMSNGNAAQNFAISGTVPPPNSTGDKHYLLATAAFAALPGAPVPDALIPAGSLPFFVVPGGATISFGGFDSWPTGAVPTDGINSVSRVGGTGVNSPTNFAGDSGSVDAAPPSVPSSTKPIALLMLAVLTATGLLAARRAQHVAT